MSAWPLAFGVLSGAFSGALLIASADPSSAPETHVEISVYDLVGKPHVHHTQGPKLPTDYGDRVAAAVRASAPALRTCLEKEPAGTTERAITARLSIAPGGKAEASLPGKHSDVDACLETVLAGISFPPHPLHEPVKVALPLHLQRRVTE